MVVLQTLRSVFARPWVRWTLLILLLFVLGWVGSLLLIPAPRIGVIQFGDIIWWDTIAPLETQLRHAEMDPSIRAVVIEVESPGGEAAASERLYYEILKLRRRKPVVVMVDALAASGAYYLASAADTIYCTPSSDVGNVGVISMYPSPSLVVEEYVFTGPFKAFGNPRDTFMRQMDILKSSFVECVFAQREDRLKIDRETLSRGELYVGTLALQLGLVDELGSRDDAVAEAARLAGVDHYTVVNIAEELLETGETVVPTPLPYEDVQARLSSPAWRPGYYFLYIPPQQGGEP